MCKKWHECWHKFETCSPPWLLFFGTALTIIGIGWSIIQYNDKTMLDENNHSIVSSFLILCGVLLIGWAFYLKGKINPIQKLSAYGHFMLGLATLIALPQTPEILRNLLAIKEGVKALNKSEDKITKILQQLNTEILDFTAEINASLLLLKLKSSDKKDIINLLSNITIPDTKHNYPAAEPSQDYAIPPNSNPTPGKAYLSQSRAEYIFNELKDKKDIDPNHLEKLLRNNLEIWYPKDNSEKGHSSPIK